MDLAQILRTLWRWRIAMVGVTILAALGAVAVVYDVSGFPPKLESKSLEFGAASTQVMVDSPKSTLAAVEHSSDLSGRALLFGNVMATDPVLREVALDAGVPRQAIVATGPVSVNATRAAKESNAEMRGNELIAEYKLQRLSFSASLDLPVIGISARAPTAEAAVRLADAAATGFQRYIEERQEADGVRAKNRVVIRQLGEASGGMLNEGASKVAAVMAFGAIFVLGCFAVLMLANIADNWRNGAADDVFLWPGAYPPDDRGIANGSSGRVNGEAAADRGDEEPALDT